MPMKLVRKDDHSIEVVATLEVLYGTAEISEAKYDADGKLQIEWTGGTKVNWDSQETFKDSFGRVFLDENDCEVSERDIELIEIIEAEDEDETDDELLYQNFFLNLGPPE